MHRPSTVHGPERGARGEEGGGAFLRLRSASCKKLIKGRSRCPGPRFTGHGFARFSALTVRRGGLKEWTPPSPCVLK